MEHERTIELFTLGAFPPSACVMCDTAAPTLLARIAGDSSGMDETSWAPLCLPCARARARRIFETMAERVLRLEGDR